MDEPEVIIDQEELSNSGRALDKFLDGDQHHQNSLLEVLDHHLVGELGPESGGRLFEAISFFADEEFADTFMGYLTYADQDEALREAINGVVSPAVGAYLRKVLAMHGSQVTEAALVYGQDPHAWREFSREVFFDVISESWRVRIEIATYGGEVVALNETPTSTLLLANAMLDTLMSAIESAGPDVLEPTLVEPLRERVSDFLAATAEVDADAADTANANEGEAEHAIYL